MDHKNGDRWQNDAPLCQTLLREQSGKLFLRTLKCLPLSSGTQVASGGFDKSSLSWAPAGEKDIRVGERLTRKPPPENKVNHKAQDEKGEGTGDICLCWEVRGCLEDTYVSRWTQTFCGTEGKERIQNSQGCCTSSCGKTHLSERKDGQVLVQLCGGESASMAQVLRMLTSALSPYSWSYLFFFEIYTELTLFG